MKTDYQKAWEEIFSELDSATRELIESCPDGRASIRLSDLADEVAAGKITVRCAVKSMNSK